VRTFDPTERAPAFAGAEVYRPDAIVSIVFSHRVDSVAPRFIGAFAGKMPALPTSRFSAAVSMEHV